MADTKKEQERAELHRTIWGIADDLRGSVDGWDFKQYVLGMLFYRYISENLTKYINQDEIEAGNDGFDYTQLPDEEAEQAREDKLFGELSDIIHGDYDEQMGLQKYEALHQLVVGVLSKVKSSKEIMDAIGTLGWNKDGGEAE